MRKKLSAFAIGILTVSLPSMSLAQTCLKTMNWRWWSNLAYENDLTIGPGTYPQTYSYGMNQAFPTYINTDLDPGVGPYGEGEVEFTNSIWGLLKSPAWARTWSGSTECTVPTGTGYADGGFCNGTTMKADRGLVTFNDSHLNSKPISILHRVALHEIGHIFGLAHPTATGCNSFMEVPVSTTSPTSLNSTELNWINSTY